MSQVSIINIQGQYPQIPTQFNGNVGFAIPIANQLDIYATYVPAGLNPARTVAAGKTVQVEIQLTQAAVVSDVLKAGLASFDDTFFAVDANGFVTYDGPLGSDLTITGNGGPAIPPVLNNWNFRTTNATVSFSGALIDASQTLDFGITNLLLGSLGAITSGDRNVSLGANALSVVSSGTRNVAAGFNSSLLLTSQIQTVSIGDNALAVSSSGLGQNTAIGADSLSSLVSGQGNLAAGYGSGQNYTGAESNNITLGNDGTLGDSNAIRVGTQGSHTTAFMAGITGVTVAASAPVGVAASGQLSSLGFGTANQVLTSNGAGASPTWQANAGVGDMKTLTGNDNVAVPPDGVGNTDVITANTTAKFVSGLLNTLALDFGYDNLAIGSSMPALTSANRNVGLGNGILSSVTNAFGNVCIGQECALTLDIGQGNVIMGYDCASGFEDGNRNVIIGSTSSRNFVSGIQNVILGCQSADNLINGDSNVIIGNGSGTALTSNESVNIYISNPGATGESGAIRIGSDTAPFGPHTKNFQAGITGVTVAASAPVGVNASGQLSSLGLGTALQVLTSNGAASPTWQAPISATFLNSNVLVGASISLTSNTPANLTSLLLPVGRWVITALVQFGGAPTVTGSQQISFNNTSATHSVVGVNSAQDGWTTTSFAFGPVSTTMPSFVQNVLAPTTYYLVVSGIFSAGAMTAYGRLTALRIS